MGLQNGTILDGATVSASGGTSKTLVADGVDVVSGIHLIDSSNSDVTTQLSMTAKTKPATLDSKTGKWTKSKSQLTVTIPQVIDTVQEFPSVFITYSGHPKMTAAEKLRLRSIAAQTLVDADFTAFWDIGSKQ